MCKGLKYHSRMVLFSILNMFMRFTKQVLKIKLCQFLWLVVITIFFIVLWIFSQNNNNETQVVKISTQYPVLLWWTMEFPGSSDIRQCSSDVKCYVFSEIEKDKTHNIEAYLFYASNINFNKLPLPRKPNQIVWGLFHEESPRNVEELLHEQTLNLFNFSSTFSRFSDVPFPLQYLKSFEDITSTRYFVETSLKDAFLEDLAPIMYLQSDCETSTERDLYVKELMKYLKIDSYGKCLHNKDLPPKFTVDYLNNLYEDEFLKFVARYKFVIAIENGVCNDYVTEKYWRAIKVGSVPIYFGSPSIRDWLPNNKSALLLQDYPTPKLLYEKIKQLLDNNTMYEEYLEHKTKQVITNEVLLNEFKQRPYQFDGIKTIEKFECFVCEKLHERLKGISDVNVVSKSHYDCPKPISALSLKVNPHNSWVYSWESAEINSKNLYNEIMNRN